MYGDVEVCQMYVSSFVEEDVIWFDVSANDHRTKFAAISQTGQMILDYVYETYLWTIRLLCR